MTYGHAERNLALLRQLEAETRQLLESLHQPDPEQSAWLQEAGCAGLASSLEFPTTGPSDKSTLFPNGQWFFFPLMDECPRCGLAPHRAFGSARSIRRRRPRIPR
jgi:hypothetical protein